MQIPSKRRHLLNLLTGLGFKNGVKNSDEVWAKIKEIQESRIRALLASAFNHSRTSYSSVSALAFAECISLFFFCLCTLAWRLSLVTKASVA